MIKVGVLLLVVVLVLACAAHYEYVPLRRLSQLHFGMPMWQVEKALGPPIQKITALRGEIWIYMVKDDHPGKYRLYFADNKLTRWWPERLGQERY